MTKSRILFSIALKGQAFKPYNITGKYLTFDIFITMSAVEERPIIPYMALNDL